MALCDIKNQEAVIDSLRRALSEGKLPHAQLIIGEKKVRAEISLELAKALLCGSEGWDACDSCDSCRKASEGNHEDIIFVEKNGATIKTEDVSELISMLAYKALGKRSIAIIDPADSVTVPAQNKLLKTLEEPPGDAVLILAAEREKGLLPTVISRCNVHRLGEDISLKLEGSPFAEKASEFLDLLLDSNPYYKRWEYIESLELSREATGEFIDILEIELLRRLRKSFSEDNKGETEGVFSDASPGKKGIALIDIVSRAKKEFIIGCNPVYVLRSVCLRAGLQDFSDE